MRIMFRTRARERGAMKSAAEESGKAMHTGKPSPARSTTTSSGSPRIVNAPRVARVAIIGSPEKPAARESLERVRAWAARHAQVVFTEITFDSERALAAGPHVLIVLGGDGTLIGAVHGLGERQIPIVGVNLGKLGYLADFTVEQLEHEGAFLFGDDVPITRRALLDVSFEPTGGPPQRTLAVNDCVLLAGAPFHMIDLTVAADDDEITFIRGDGLIVATASGSTAHNLSAGGPILEPTAESFILTPICPHALTYRPLVLDSRRRIIVRASTVNAGTTASIDGRIRHPFQLGDRVVITRHPANFLLVRNPKHSAWHALRRKLKWGEGPPIR
jgi:NAD+ kinase